MYVVCEAYKFFTAPDKTEVFLELYGNINVRQQSMEYVEKMAPSFIK